jgi:hypothetical protein
MISTVIERLFNSKTYLKGELGEAHPFPLLSKYVVVEAR